jgi:proline-specific peptidase
MMEDKGGVVGSLPFDSHVPILWELPVCVCLFSQPRAAVSLYVSQTDKYQSSQPTMAIEGKAPFAVEGIETPCETWYKVFGDLKDSTQTPLIVLHGGPAAGHEYLLSLHTLSDLVIFYDQLGCANSTLLPEKDGDKGFWVPELFCKELSNLIEHLGLADRPLDIIGHSWGGMLATEWASEPSRAENVRRLILYGVPASMDGHIQGMVKVREGLPQDAQEALQHALDSREYTSPEYKNAMLVFAQNHLSLSKPFPIAEIAPALSRMATSEMHHTM